MITLKTVDSSILAFIVLVFIYINAYKRSEYYFTQNRLFIALVSLNIIMLVIDYLGWAFNGLPGEINLICNTGFNLLLYILIPLPANCWVLYVDYQVNHDDDRLKKVKTILNIFVIINALISVASIYTGWFYRVDANNIYHRGPYFLVHVGYCYAIILYALFKVLHNRARLERRYFKILLLYFLPWAIGTVLQTIFYGLSTNWTGMMLSILILYFNIQDRGLKTDYLTGVYNRRQSDEYIKARIRNSTYEKSFSVILMDLDNFKKINDLYGHNTGDDALRDAVEIIRKSLRQNDFIARFGGDEFIAVLDIDEPEQLDATVKRIYENAEKYNQNSNQPYQLSFSMGYDIYDAKTKTKQDDFFRHIDLLMYQNKKLKNS